MKKILLLALAAIAVLGAGVLSIRHYKKYQNKEVAKVQAVENAKDAQIASLTERVELYKAAYDRERIECEKGAAIYDSLTTFQLRNASAPVCGPAIVK